MNQEDFEKEFVGKIHCADCLELMRDWPDGCVDLVLTDPPYGIDFGKAGGFCASHGWGPWRENVEWDIERPPKAAFDLMLRLGKHQIIWGGNYFTDYLPRTMRWLVWDKGQREFSLADCEFAWNDEWKASRIFNYPRGCALKDGKQHPTQKPLALMEWCLDFYPDAAVILDCYSGVGTTCVAAKKLGRRFIGIDISPEYCKIARERLEACDTGVPVKEARKGQGALFV